MKYNIQNTKEETQTYTTITNFSKFLGILCILIAVFSIYKGVTLLDSKACIGGVIGIVWGYVVVSYSRSNQE